MPMRTSTPHTCTRLTLASAVAAFVVCASSSARADEQLLIKNPGDHPRYFFDAEPHGLVGYGPFVRNFSAGAGFRGTFILVQNGFVPTINNSIGLGVGADAFFPARGSGPCVVPVVMQWNFWLSTHWSVFGEPGVAVAFGSRDYVVPTFSAGGRYHFNERIALTMRLGYPALTVGVSFFL